MIETHSFQFGGAAITNGLLVVGFAQYSLLTGITFAIVTSLVAAFVEESAFRGYMQSDLERRLNRPLTIVMVALAFAVFHLYGRTLQQWSAGLADWVVISAVFSVLVILTGSIVPAVVCHFLIDLALFSLDWFQDPLHRLREIAPGVHLSWGAILCCVSAAASAAAFAKLAKVTRADLDRLTS
jgi:membrane protease YdiL (CAAX protease family)